ncbi:MAG: protein-L-isoaspartate(D-aspartate) O-methyltransferase [Candidatus Marinimicrobia bacterium]|nr:protein-L-isoaspartate(D-aspartate) O-methyltransferase [Candidatus Neomarinimicrobiota bacterium]
MSRIFLLLWVYIWIQCPVFSQVENWEQKAKEMVDNQIKARGVSDHRVLNTMRQTPRHEFIPNDQWPYAYGDFPLPIGYEQTISQPYIVGLMTSLLKLKGNEKVLEIGTGSGYQAAVLSPLCNAVFTIEIVKELAERSAKTLKDLGYDNIHVKWGDGYQGWPNEAPFDAIIVTAAPPELPPKLFEQLKIGGRLVIPVGSIWQELWVITKLQGGIMDKESVIPVRFVPMVHPKKPIPNQE